jgi:hypothetical protein
MCGMASRNRGGGGLLFCVLVAEARQNAHRVCLAAEGAWALLSALIAAISLHGLFGRR